MHKKSINKYLVFSVFIFLTINESLANHSLFGLNIYNSTDIPKAISTTSTSTVISTITVPASGAGVITDINLTNLDISHTYIDDLTITLTSPSGTVVTLVSGLCSFHDDLLIDFDDEGDYFFSIPCPPTDGLAYQASGSLSAFDDQNPVGVWTLQIEDNSSGDGGSLNDWSLEILTDVVTGGACTQPTCTYNHNSPGCTNYTLNSGDTLCINENYNCTITLNQGSAVYVAAGVTFAPNINGQVRGTIINCGTSNFGGFTLEDDAVIINNGLMNFNSSINLNGTAEFTNNLGGEMNFNSNFALDNQSIFNNTGIVDVNGSFEVRQGTVFTNNFELNISNNFTTHTKGTTINNGLVVSQNGNININTGSSVINNCTFNAPNQININEDLQNNGLLYTGNGNGNITLNTSATLSNNGDIVTRNLNFNGVVEGNGYIWATGNTLLNSSGKIGLDGKGLNIYDSSTPPNGQFFDTQNGTVHSSVTNNPPSGSNPIPPPSFLANTCSPELQNNTVPEICNNGIDDDGDGLTDCDDPDCSFETVITPGTILCIGANTGTATATTDKGGVVPISYSWSNGVTAITITNLSPGTYTVTATDAIGCSSVVSATVSELPAMVIDTTITGVSCLNLFDGQIDLSVSGGTAPYSYSWSNGQNTQDISGLGAGNYTVTIQDDNSCNQIHTFSVDSPAEVLSVVIDSLSDYNGFNISCFEGSDGIIYASGNGGTPPYSYLWSNGQTTATASGLSIGYYNVTVTDDNGCVTNTGLNINQPQQLNGGTTIISNYGSFHVSCNGETDAEGYVFSYEGVGPYNYEWSNGSTHDTLSGVGSGTYYVTTTDVNNCQYLDSIVFLNPPQRTINLQLTSGINCAGNTGAVVATPTGGSGGDTFLWSNGGTNNNINSLPAGTYTVTVTDIYDCSVVDDITIPGSTAFQINFNTTNADCGLDNGTISTTIVGGTSPYTYIWNNGSTNSNISNLAEGTYIVTVQDNLGCQAIDSTILGSFLNCSEICDNGFDDDGDGNTDCDDSDCQPEANNTTLNACDNSNMTGSGVFFLHDANPTVTTESGVTISYHPNLSDAQNGINNLISPHTSSDGIVYVRAERISTGCFNTALITLDVGTKCVESCVNGVDDDGDGLVDYDDSECPCYKVNAPNLNDLTKN